MKAIEEYKLTGTIANENVNGKVTSYTNNIKKFKPLGLKVAVIKSFEKLDEKILDSVTNIVNYAKNHPELTKKVVTGTLILVMATSFTGCSIVPDAQTKAEVNINEIVEITEPTGEIKYFIKSGDTLESIVHRYLDKGIQNEINKICIENNISNPDKIYSGQELILHIPVSKLENFGFTYTLGEVNEYAVMDHFVYSAFNVDPNDVHPQNVMFWRDREYVIGDTNTSPHEIHQIGNEKPILVKAASAIYDLEIMTGDQLGFYKEEDIKNKEYEILSYYKEAIEIAERNTGKKYGEDYILNPPVKAIPIEKSLGI